MYQHFCPYYQKQYYSISGYFHISLNLSLAEIKSLPEVKEWLENHTLTEYSLRKEAEDWSKVGKEYEIDLY